MSDDLSSRSDAELIAVARRGGTPARRAFGRLVDRYQARVVRLCSHLLGRSCDAEDVAQEAFVRAYLAIERYPVGVPFWPWIRKVATRLAFNHRRARSTRKRHEDRVDTPAAAGQPLAARDALEHALDELSYPYREILVLRYVEEMAIKDIAEHLNLGESAAKMRLSRARAEFRERHDALAK